MIHISSIEIEPLEERETEEEIREKREKIVNEIIKIESVMKNENEAENCDSEKESYLMESFRDDGNKLEEEDEGDGDLGNSASFVEGKKNFNEENEGKIESEEKEELEEFIEKIPKLEFKKKPKKTNSKLTPSRSPNQQQHNLKKKINNTKS